jgi:hypothetical protein
MYGYPYQQPVPPRRVEGRLVPALQGGWRGRKLNQGIHMARGSGFLYKQKRSKNWWAQWYVNGKRFRLPSNTSDHDEALKVLTAGVK